MNPGTSFVRILNSEWIKFRTLRSSWITLLGSVFTLFGLGLLSGWNASRPTARLEPGSIQPSWMLDGRYVSQLLIGTLGVLLVSGEYSTGMIRSTLAAVPRRLPVLLAKAVVFGGLVLVTMTAATVATYLGAVSFLSAADQTGLTEPGVLRAVLGTALYLALVGLLGGASSWILRNTAGAITTLIGVLVIVPVLVATLPWPWLKDIGRYLPANAGEAFVTSAPGSDSLTPGTGLVVLLVWVVAAFVLAGVLLKRRDV
jgi:ABC-2 type transport system permease protein